MASSNPYDIDYCDDWDDSHGCEADYPEDCSRRLECLDLRHRLTDKMNEELDGTNKGYE